MRVNLVIFYKELLLTFLSFYYIIRSVSKLKSKYRIFGKGGIE